MTNTFDAHKSLSEQIIVLLWEKPRQMQAEIEEALNRPCTVALRKLVVQDTVIPVLTTGERGEFYTLYELRDHVGSDQD